MFFKFVLNVILVTCTNQNKKESLKIYEEQFKFLSAEITSLSCIFNHVVRRDEGMINTNSKNWKYELEILSVTTMLLSLKD